MKVKSREVVEIKQKLIMAIGSRVFVANESKNVDLEIISTENLDGSNPHILIRIKSSSAQVREKDLNLKRIYYINK